MPEDQERFAEQLLSVVNDAARSVSTRFVTFLSVALYIGITLASTSDEMLLKGSLVSLPLLNVQIPIKAWYGFYSIAPWLIVGLHLDLLLQFVMLASKLSSLRSAAAKLGEEQRSRLRERIASYYYVQFLAHISPTRLLHALSGLVFIGTAVVVPLVLLCWTQIRLRPIESLSLSLSHQLALLVDVGLILVLLWRMLAASPIGLFPPPTERRGHVRALTTLHAIAIAASVAAVAVSLVSWLPHERWVGLKLPIKWRALDLQTKVLTVDPLTPEAIVALESGQADQRERALDKISRQSLLQGQDLQYANMFKAVLPKVDLRPQYDTGRRTSLRRADLRWAVMPQVLLDGTDMAYANLTGAGMQGAILSGALLDGADLSLARLQDAKLNNASLRGAFLIQTQLQGADLSGADFQEATDVATSKPAAASLSQANLRGAFLRKAKLQGADLSSADLRGADLTGARLEGAILDGALLEGAILTGAVFSTDQIKTSSGDIASINKLLSAMACEDPYVARGLAIQATMRSADEKAMRPNLAHRLVEALADPECRGLAILPAGSKTRLRNEAKAAPVPLR
jgi:uncharacterized protein YjbI with pentapeptide repeats